MWRLTNAKNGTMEKLGDHIEVDETYISGKARNMPLYEREEKIKVHSPVGRPSAEIRERGGEVRIMHVEQVNFETSQGIVKVASTRAGTSTRTNTKL